MVKYWQYLEKFNLKRTQMHSNQANSFFSYEANEALHLSEKERQIIIECLNKIDYELHQSIDKHSKTLIANNIELLLNYGSRIYERQLITRSC